VKGFLKQVKFEIRNIIKSRFLLIIGILLIAAAVVFPVINLAASRKTSSGGGVIEPYPMRSVAVDMPGKMPMPIDPGMQESITVDGVTIYSDNPFFWQIQSAIQEKEWMENDQGRFSSPEALDLTLSLMDEEIKYYLNFAKHVTSYADYRSDLAWRSTDSLYDKFVFEHIDAPQEALLEAVSQRRYFEPELFQTKYLDLAPEDRLAELERLDEELTTLYSIVETNDFPKYVEMRILQENNTISDLEDQIAIQEQEIIKNPSQEEIINNMIMELRRNIKMIEENTIPILQLRLEKNIIPGEDTWQNSALSNIEMYRQQLTYTEIISEEEFQQQMWLVQQYRTYQNYVEAIQKQIDNMNNEIIIAEKSIDADKPDMKYVYNGSRNRTVRFLNYSVFVTLFAVLLGGWLMASEFQQGTIRLLMIRPKTRTKILAAKFLSALIICLVVYAAGSLLNAVTNGLCFGFADYAFPNYTISGEIGFIAYYLPKMLACILPILFGYATAFLLSVVVKNVAVAIALPIAGYIGSMIFMTVFSFRGMPKWLTYTPLPYMQLSTYLTQAANNQYFDIYSSGVTVNLTYGMILLAVLSVLFAVLSSIVFQKRDIVN
jgi:ABC-2 type transport system permease protein